MYIYNSSWLTIFGILTFLLHSDAELLITESNANYYYHLYFVSTRYSWTNARSQCSSNGYSLVAAPVSRTVMNMLVDWVLEDDVWITDQLGNCLSLREECTRTSSSHFGSETCIETESKAVQADCNSKKHYVICMEEYTTTARPTTTATTTTRRRTTATTTTTTRRRPTDTTRSVLPSTLKPTTTRRTTQRPTTATRNGERADQAPKRASALPANKHVGGMTGFMIGMAVAKQDLLGLIIGVVTGTFLILSLVFVLCCACQGKTDTTPKRYERVERDSNNSLINKNISNSSTNTLEGPCRTVTTEESSLEMSDARSHSTKQSDHDISHYYPPPPSLYDSPNTDNIYGILPTINQHQTKLNPLYNHKQSARDSLLTEELPLPPPPPPPHGIAEDDDEDTCIKGLNPTFKTFLDHTIAIKPTNVHMNGSYSPVSPTSPYRCQDAPEQERRGLITSDL